MLEEVAEVLEGKRQPHAEHDHAESRGALPHDKQLSSSRKKSSEGGSAECRRKVHCLLRTICHRPKARLPVKLIFKQKLDRRFNFAFLEIFESQIAICIDYTIPRIGFDFVGLSRVAIVVLGDGVKDVVFLGNLRHKFVALRSTDSNQNNTLVAILLNQFFVVRNGINAMATPCRPEIENNDFAS